MGIQGTFGVKMKLDGATVVSVLEASFPEQLKELAEMTPHPIAGATGYKQFVDTGVRELGEFTVTLAWDDTEATHAAVLTAFSSTTASALSVEDPAGQEVIAFSAFIRSIGRLTPTPDGYKARVTIRPTGAPTIS